MAYLETLWLQSSSVPSLFSTPSSWGSAGFQLAQHKFMFRRSYWGLDPQGHPRFSEIHGSWALSFNPSEKDLNHLPDTGPLCLVFIHLVVTDGFPTSKLDQCFQTEKEHFDSDFEVSLGVLCSQCHQSVSWKQYNGNCCGEQFVSDKAPGPGCLQTVRMIFAQL